jgi:hypothetical protein
VAAVGGADTDALRARAALFTWSASAAAHVEVYRSAAR